MITFGSSQDSFYRQIARLDYILQEARSQASAGQLKSVNLAIGDKQVPVSFGNTGDGRDSSRAPSASARRLVPPTGTALFNPPSRNSSPSKRDF